MGGPACTLSAGWLICQLTLTGIIGVGSFMTATTPPSAARPGDQSIGDACAETGLSPRTVRYYEELGLLPGVRRRAGGRRVYGPDEIERLRFIQRLKQMGLRLAEIKELSAIYGLAGSTHDMLLHLEELLGRHLAEVEGRMEALSGLRDELHRYRDRVGARIQAAGTGG